MKTEKLAWLAGIWDGEGTIGMASFNGQWFDKKRNQIRRESKLKPYIVIVNTSVVLINEAIKILDECGITLCVYQKKKKEKKYHKDCYIITSFNMHKIRATLELLLPYLVSKKPQAELLLRFVHSRLERMKDNPSGRSTPHYTEDELEVAQKLLGELKILNKRSSEEQILTDYTLDAQKVMI